MGFRHPIQQTVGVTDAHRTALDRRRGMIDILPVVHCARSGSRPGGAVQRKVLHPFAGHLVGQKTAEPGGLQAALLDRFVQAVPLAAMHCGQTKLREGGEGPTQTNGVQGFKERIFAPLKAVFVEGLTKFDYLVNVLLGSFLCSHKLNFLPKGGFAQGHCRPNFCLSTS